MALHLYTCTIAHCAILFFYYCPLGIHKKLEATAKQKECQLIGEWQRSIINHLYWCIASTSPGDGDMIKAKWKSLQNHIHNVHRGHSDIFPDCAHPPEHIHGRKKKWFRRRKS